MSWRFWLFQMSLVICLADAGFTQDLQPAEKEMVEEQTDQQAGDQAADDDEYSEMTLDELSTDFSTKMRVYMKRYRAAPTKEAKRKVFKTIPAVKSYQNRLVELIDEDPGSAAGLEVVDWWYRRGGRRESSDTIVRLILKNYSQLKSIEEYVPRIAWFLPKDEAEKELRSLLQVNPFDAVKASATYELHQLLVEQAKELKGQDAEAVGAEVKTLRDAIYNDYPDASDITGAKFVGLLDAVAFAAKLEIGQPVPDIIGTDLDGVDFKLSDYDGKVRVISFWGDW